MRDLASAFEYYGAQYQNMASDAARRESAGERRINHSRFLNAVTYGHLDSPNSGYLLVMVVTGTHFPSFTWYKVELAFFRSPAWLNEISPVMPWNCNDFKAGP
jgi:hypothetical protein